VDGANFELTSGRLALEPLRVEHAREMVPVVGEYEGLDEAGLRARYARQVAGRGRGWLNWVVRMDGAAVGTVQATVRGDAAELAWVVGPAWRGAGVASEAVALVVEWLRGRRVVRFVAHIAPENLASAGVARRLGMVPTDVVREDGEVLWSSI
jgi:RimJ/RimL family protein N-acetyltransferase